MARGGCRWCHQPPEASYPGQPCVIAIRLRQGTRLFVGKTIDSRRSHGARRLPGDDLEGSRRVAFAPAGGDPVTLLRYYRDQLAEMPFNDPARLRLTVSGTLNSEVLGDC